MNPSQYDRSNLKSGMYSGGSNLSGTNLGSTNLGSSSGLGNTYSGSTSGLGGTNLGSSSSLGGTSYSSGSSNLGSTNLGSSYNLGGTSYSSTSSKFGENKLDDKNKFGGNTYLNSKYASETTGSRDFGDWDSGSRMSQTNYIGQKPELLGGEPKLILKEKGELRSTVFEEAAQRSIRERGPVVHERIHHIEEEDVQPIIHLERLKTEVVHITQPIKESQVMPTMIHERQLPAEMRPEVVVPGTAYAPREMLPSVQYEAPERVQVLKPPIVEEVIKKNIIEEVQPVIERDVFQPHIVKETKQIYEKVVEAPIVREETRSTIDKGMLGKIDILRASPDLINQFNSPGGSPYSIVEQKIETTTTTTTTSPAMGTQMYSGLPASR